MERRPLWVRHTIPFRTLSEARSFLDTLNERADLTAAEQPLYRQRYWVSVDARLSYQPGTLGELRQYWTRRSGIDPNEHVRQWLWPTRDFEHTLLEQAETLFGEAADRPMLCMDFVFTGAGWAEVVIVAGENGVVFTASDVAPALHPLAALLLPIWRGEARSACSFAEEPGEHRIVATREATGVRVDVLRFDDVWSHRPDPGGELIFRESVGLAEATASVVSCLQRVQARYGVEGIAELWSGAGFPHDEMEELQTRLAHGTVV